MGQTGWKSPKFYVWCIETAKTFYLENLDYYYCNNIFFVIMINLLYKKKYEQKSVCTPTQTPFN